MTDATSYPRNQSARFGASGTWRIVFRDGHRTARLARADHHDAVDGVEVELAVADPECATVDDKMLGHQPRGPDGLDAGPPNSSGIFTESFGRALHPTNVAGFGQVGKLGSAAWRGSGVRVQEGNSRDLTDRRASVII